MRRAPGPARSAPAAMPVVVAIGFDGPAADHPSVYHTCIRIVRAMAWAFGGQLVLPSGKGLVVVFADSRNALECAAGVQRAIAAYARRRPNVAVRVRIAVRGSILDWPGGPSLWSDDALDLAQVADGGEIIVSETVVGACEPHDFEFGPAEFANPGADATEVVRTLRWEPGEHDDIDPAFVAGYDAGRDALGSRLLAAALRGEGTA